MSADTEIPASDQALLSAATSASIEIERMTAQLVAGRARPKAVKSCGFARSELRRCLRALGMVRDAREQRDDQSAPPPNATDEQRREWSRKYVEGALAEAAAK